MLYPKNEEPQLSDSLFQNPTSEYRGTPFWAWNTRLTTEKLHKQIEMLKTMGMGGFHMHVRTGMDSPYLDEEFMGYIQDCITKAKEENMLAWLYDEDRLAFWCRRSERRPPENPRMPANLCFLRRNLITPDRPHKAQKPEPGRGRKFSPSTITASH